MTHLYLLAPQTGIPHPRFDFFFNEQRQEVHAHFHIMLPEKRQTTRT